MVKWKMQGMLIWRRIFNFVSLEIARHEDGSLFYLLKGKHRTIVLPIDKTALWCTGEAKKQIDAMVHPRL